MWQTPKTNWTADDTFNATDLNRVESNTQHVRTLMLSKGLTVPTLTVITNRTTASVDTVSSINRIESNLDALNGAIGGLPNWLETVTWTPGKVFSAVDAFRWEHSLLLLYNATNALAGDLFPDIGTSALVVPVPVLATVSTGALPGTAIASSVSNAVPSVVGQNVQLEIV